MEVKSQTDALIHPRPGHSGNSNSKFLKYLLNQPVMVFVRILSHGYGGSFVCCRAHNRDEKILETMTTFQS